MKYFYKKIFFILSLLILSISVCLAAHLNASGYISVDKGKLYYERYGSGTPILVLHGGPGLDQGYLKPQLLTLAANHEVIFYDQRGSGKSLETIIDGSTINLSQFTDDIETVRKSLGLDRVIILGHSWGGLLAMKYAITYPDHIEKLILVDTVPANFDGMVATKVELDKRVEPIKDEIAPLNSYEEFEKLNAEQIAAVYRKLFSVYVYNPYDAEKITLKMNVESARSGFKISEMMNYVFIDLFPQLTKLTVPTVVIHGENDFIPLWTAEAIANTIPKAKLVVIPECGHFPYIEKMNEFLEAI